MYQFDINYTHKEYMEYYKDVLITRKILRNVIFVLLFVAIAIVWWVDKSDNTKGNFLPIFSLVFAVIIPVSNIIYIPILNHQLKLRKAELDSIKINLTFTDNEIIYENLTVPVNLEPVEENKPVNEETPEVEVVDEDKDKYEQPDEEENQDSQKIFTLRYNNFYDVRATKNLILLALDRQIVIIIPKRTITVGTIDNFVNFLASKIPAKRFKIRGVKSTYVEETPVEETKQEENQPEENNKE